ncbi:MlaA family lipoprotein [Pseudomonas gingeri]|uniref:VacJ family lipoprotein n=1 Tax=Pseudomonas gingeri TaxID=117681 RepID=A0A7Y7YDR9_9PSED|nr:VacJ family lipoprotein [Pseudomonas gingeri]NWA02331.1 VacJ family lipoprotein [Pseudomonas gingeri]NWA12496.1 VacJ family lipoprotein [Pseudomonas gingeri]NWA57098.1 VacJ family lipoprotein [Pseudomonas gingeri]NWA93441.1 VacJ family lipoprotein [Pseudomonas gingeri]NWB02913.1 VacJ family lipoprotein [Pseudomonas gingeri]
MHPLTYSPPLARHAALLLTLSWLAGCTTPPAVPDETQCTQAPTAVYDPAESINRGVFAFNRAVDDYAMAPVARGYRHLPEFFQQGVHNFASNFSEPKVFINDLLQGNPRRSINTLGRFAVNTTVGIVGLIDVSDPIGIPRHTADFGQTFGVWGIGNGPIVELPLLGTGNSRDAAGKVLNFLVAPLGHSDTVQALGTIDLVGGTVDTRASLLPLTDSLQRLPDYYSALRNVVAEHRAAFVQEGKEGATTAQASQCPGTDEF